MEDAFPAVDGSDVELQRAREGVGKDIGFEFWSKDEKIPLGHFTSDGEI